MGLGKYGASLPKDPSKRTFAGLQRQEDGTFKDEELVNILTLAIEDVAGMFIQQIALITRLRLT
jgi:linoleate 10R-lipoxygenase